MSNYRVIIVIIIIILIIVIRVIIIIVIVIQFAKKLTEIRSLLHRMHNVK